MSSKIKCPVCGSELKVLNSRHINSKKHQRALKKKGISPQNDPALKYTKTKSSAKRKSQSSSIVQIKKRIKSLEEAVIEIKRNQSKIIKVLKSANVSKGHYSDQTPSERPSTLKVSNIKSAIVKCVHNNQDESIWVKIDEVISLMKLNRESERKQFNNLLIKMFNKNIVDLAEGGDPKYPVTFQNRMYGMVALQ